MPNELVFAIPYSDGPFGKQSERAIYASASSLGIARSVSCSIDWYLDLIISSSERPSMRGTGIEDGKMSNGLSVKMTWRIMKVELEKRPIPIGVSFVKTMLVWLGAITGGDGGV